MVSGSVYFRPDSGHSQAMTANQRLPTSLTPLDVALGRLLRGVEPVTSRELALAEALRCIAAEMPALGAQPPNDVAASDGFALCTRDLVGASSYTPLPLASSPLWVEAGDKIPGNCDCVVDADCVDQTGPLPQVLAEAIPGQGVCRAGRDIAAGSQLIEAGRRVRPRDLLIARAAGLEKISVRRPRLRAVNSPGGTMTANLIAETARAAGAEVILAEAASRATAAIADVLDADCDLLVTIGGSGVGRTDGAIAALAKRGEVMAHGIALQPGRTSAVGKVGKTPVIALPGAPDQALAVWLALAVPALDRLAGRRPRRSVTLPLKRKIASHVGIAEIVLLERNDGGFVPSAVGDLSLETIARADAWLLVPGGSEGFAAGAQVDAYMLRQ
jgi:molybdopterin molybdotransferase